APVVGGLVGPSACDDGTELRDHALEPGRVLAGRLAEIVLGLVRPRTSEDPVVQPLATLAESLRGAVVRAGDVAVDRRRDSCEHLGHRALLRFRMGTQKGLRE